jgi:hypothetical protein
METTTLDQQRGIRLLQKALEIVSAKLASEDGSLKVRPGGEPRAVGAKDEKLLRLQLEAVENENREVSGDDTDEEGPGAGGIRSVFVRDLMTIFVLQKNHQGGKLSQNLQRIARATQTTEHVQNKQTFLAVAVPMFLFSLHCKQRHHALQNVRHFDHARVHGVESYGGAGGDDVDVGRKLQLHLCNLGHLCHLQGVCDHAYRLLRIESRASCGTLDPRMNSPT